MIKPHQTVDWPITFIRIRRETLAHHSQFRSWTAAVSAKSVGSDCLLRSFKHPSSWSVNVLISPQLVRSTLICVLIREMVMGLRPVGAVTQRNGIGHWTVWLDRRRSFYPRYLQSRFPVTRSKTLHQRQSLIGMLMIVWEHWTFPFVKDLNWSALWRSSSRQGAWFLIIEQWRDPSVVPVPLTS